MPAPTLPSAGATGYRRRLLLAAAALLLFVGRAPATVGDGTVSLQYLDVTELPRVSLYLSVVGADGRSVLGLTEAELELTVDGVDQQIGELQSALAGGESLAVALLFDRSGSMKGALERTRAAAADFIGRLSVRDEIAVISFDDRVRVDSPLTADREQVENAVAAIEPGNNTALWDALARATRLLGETGSKRRAVVLLSDGKDTRSGLAGEEVVALLQKEGIPVFALSLAEDADREALDEMAARTGGRVLGAAAPGDLLGLYQTIAEELNNQYLLRFDSSFGEDERWHTLRLGLRGAAGGGEARMERQYFASTGPGVSRTALSGFERRIERTGLAVRAAFGALAGLLAGLVLLGLVRLARPGRSVLAPVALGLLASALLLGALLALLLVVF